jgi:hypothetical protein
MIFRIFIVLGTTRLDIGIEIMMEAIILIICFIGIIATMFYVTNKD